MKTKQQVVVIHGGTSFKRYRDYLQFLKAVKIDIAKFKAGKGWKLTLEDKLGSSYEVLHPRMPNASNAKYAEWKLWFEKVIPFIRDGVILVGHSLGGLFLAKYLSEHYFPKKIKAVFLLAAPFSKADKKVIPSDFARLRSLKRLGKQTRHIYIFHSKDDKQVPWREALRYKEALAGTEVHLFSDKGHFSQDTFPELVRKIKAATKLV